MSVASADIFGIQMIKPTKAGGQIWFQYNTDFNDDPQVYTYSATNEYLVHNVEDYDGTRFTISKSDAFECYISPSTGLNPAACITDQQEMARRGYMQSPQDWKNVEVTAQLVIFTEGSDFITFGFRGGRLQGSGSPTGCTGSMYLVDISMAQGGLIRVRKQSWNISVHNWLSQIVSGFDSGKPCGFTVKILVYNTEANNGVNVEVWLAAFNDNHFVKVLSGLDSGQLNTDATVCNCTTPGQPLIWGSPAVMLKGTSGRFGFKNWSIREIQGYGTNLPPSPPPPGGGDTGGGTTPPPPSGGGSGSGGGGGSGGGEPVDLTPILATPATSYIEYGGGPNFSPLDVYFIFAGDKWNSAPVSTPGGTTTTYVNPTLATPKSTGVKDFGGPVWDKAVVYFIFWGSGWNTQTTPWSRQNLITAINAIFDTTKGFFDGLIQYKYARRPSIGGFVTNTTYIPDGVWPDEEGYVADMVTECVMDSINRQLVPHPGASPNTRYMYYVFGPPDHMAASLTQGAWHINYNYEYPTEQLKSYLIIGHTSYTGTFDQQTFGLTHELIGMISDPTGSVMNPNDGHTAFQTDPNGPLKDLGPEISDVCVEAPDTRLSGYLVCPYWSNQDNMCVSPNTSVKPSWVSCPTNSTWDNTLQQCKKTTTTPGTTPNVMDSANSTLKTMVMNAVGIMFADANNYFKALYQYGRTKLPVLKGSVVNTTAAIPTASYTQAQINTIIDDSIAKGLVPRSTATKSIIYYVILPPGIRSSSNSWGWHYARGYNNYQYCDVILASSAGNVEPETGFDYLTYCISHELVEGVSENLTSLGYHVKPGTPIYDAEHPTINQLGDACDMNLQELTAKSYPRLQGIAVSRYWSDQDGKCIVPPTSGNPTPYVSCHTGAIWDNVTMTCKLGPTPGGGGTSPGSQQGYKILEAVATGDDGNVPSNAIDGNLDTRWSSFGKGEYLRLDLGTAKKVNKIKIAWYQGDRRTNNFEIRTAEVQGGAYTSKLTATSVKGSAALQDYAIAETNARYVRIYVYGNSLNDWASISEVEIWGPETTTGGSPGTGSGGDPGSGGTVPGGDTGGGTTTPVPPPEVSWNFFDTSFSVDFNKIGLCNPAE